MLYKITAIAGAALMATSAMAQTPPAQAAAKPAAAATHAATHAARTTRAPVVRTAKSLDCSKQADSKNLHGAPRRSFMASCKKA